VFFPQSALLLWGSIYNLLPSHTRTMTVPSPLQPPQFRPFVPDGANTFSLVYRQKWKMHLHPSFFFPPLFFPSSEAPLSFLLFSLCTCYPNLVDPQLFLSSSLPSAPKDALQCAFKRLSGPRFVMEPSFPRPFCHSVPWLPVTRCSCTCSFSPLPMTSLSTPIDRILLATFFPSPGSTFDSTPPCLTPRHSLLLPADVLPFAPGSPACVWMFLPGLPFLSL